MKHIDVKLKLKRDLVEHLIFGAGSGYWCEEIHVTKRNRDFVDGFTVIDREDGNVKVKVTATRVKEALVQMAVEYPERFASLVSDNFDAEDGDVFVQLCAFGELKYG